MGLFRRGSAASSARADAELAQLLDSTRRLAEAVSRADRVAQQYFELSGAQLFVLRLLAEAPAQSVNDLAARTGTHQSTVSIVVGRLVARGLVSRGPSPADGRRVTLTLTRAGRALLRRSPESAPARLEAALTRLPAGERRLLARALARLAGELTEGEPRGDVPAESPLRPRIPRRDRRHR
jgi:DNA-binding MarR family transcriptional regulator